MKALRAVGQFWYDFVIGDDWKIAAAVAICLAVGAIALVTGALSTSILMPAVALIVMAAFVAALLLDIRPRRR